MESIQKIWGTRMRIHLDDKIEIDLLYLKKDTFCSTHTHKNKINKFIVVAGKVRIESELGYTELNPNESFVVKPPMKHRFFVLEPSIMIEMAYVEDGKIDPNDINRETLGGKVIDGKEYTINDLKEKGLLDL